MVLQEVESSYLNLSLKTNYPIPIMWVSCTDSAIVLEHVLCPISHTIMQKRLAIACLSY